MGSGTVAASHQHTESSEPEKDASGDTAEPEKPGSRVTSLVPLELCLRLVLLLQS